MAPVLYLPSPTVLVAPFHVDSHYTTHAYIDLYMSWGFKPTTFAPGPHDIRSNYMALT